MANKSENAKQARANIKLILVDLEINSFEFAKRAGVGRTYVYDFLRGKTASIVGQSLLLANEAGVDADYFWGSKIYQPGDLFRDRIKVDTPDKQRPKLKLVSGFDPDAPDTDGLADASKVGGIRELDLRAGLGPGGMADRAHNHDGNEVDPVKDETWRFPQSFVRHELRRSEDRLLILETEGDSMFPTLMSGDRVIADTGHLIPSPDGLYALRDRFGGAIVKRLQLLPTGDPPRLVVISDNPAHQNVEVGIDEIHIIGKVMYALKKF